MGNELWQSTYDLLTDTAFWLEIVAALIKIVIILILARMVVSFLKKVIQQALQKRKGKDLHTTEQRSETLASLLHSVVANGIYFVAILLILDELGFSLASVLVGAGVLGLAVGFGAQNLVRDIITGFFILYEDQFSVGDFVTTGEYTGTVQDFGLRVTKIQDWTGEVNIIPNGHIEEVTNYSKENAYAVVDIGISLTANIGEAEQVIDEVVQDLYEQEEDMVEPPSIMGVQEFRESEIVIRTIALCRPVTQWGIERKMRRAIKDRFDEKGLKIPFPHRVVHNDHSGLKR